MALAVPRKTLLVKQRVSLLELSGKVFIWREGARAAFFWLLRSCEGVWSLFLACAFAGALLLYTQGGRLCLQRGYAVGRHV